MKKILLSVFFLMSVSSLAFAQTKTEKTIIIKKVVVDENGEKAIEEIVLTGSNAENVDIDDYVKREFEGVNVDINVDLDRVKKNVMIFSEEGSFLFEDIDEVISNDFKWNDCGHNVDIVCRGKTREPRAFLGVWPGDVQNEKGVILGGVVKESAADKAGLKENDVITSFEGKEVKTFSELSRLISEQEPNSKVIIQYIREGEIRSQEVVLGKKEQDTRVSYTFDNCDKKENKFMRGLPFHGCEKACEEERAYIGIMISDSEKGVYVEDVHREDDILQEGDLVKKFGRIDITDTQSLIDAVATYGVNDKVKVKLLRNNKEGKVKIRLLGRKVKVCCNDDDCCSGEKEDVEIIIRDKEVKSDLGDSRLELQDLRLFPNPTTGLFKLEFISSDLSPISITITDATGREIIRDEISDFNGRYSGDFNLESNAPGLYLVNISQSGKVLTEKVIIGKGRK